MQNLLPQDIAVSLDQLRRLIESRLTSQTEVAQATGVDQSQISRILAGQARRVTSNVITLCKYANSFDASRRNDPSRNPILMSALHTVWDGSAQHAEAIAAVILSLRKFKEPIHA